MKNIVLIITILALVIAGFIAINSIKIPAPLKINKHSISVDKFI